MKAEQIDSSNHKSIRVEVEVRTGVTVKEATKIGTITVQIAETEVSTDKIKVGLDMNQDMNRIIGEVILEEM